jgi:hypothetical protein
LLASFDVRLLEAAGTLAGTLLLGGESELLMCMAGAGVIF